MNVAAVLALAGLLASPASPSPGTLPGAEGPVSVEAETIRRDQDGWVHLEGNVVVRRGLVTLRARTARVDPDTGEVEATGGVLLTDATRAVSADGLHAVMGGPFEAGQVTAFVKDAPAPLGGATTAEEARRLGRNRLSFSGQRLEGDATGHLTLSGARLTLCDCGGGAPSWEIRARRADVIPGKRAILSWPVIYVTPRFLFVKKPVPVLPLPWLYLPLGDRQSGLLFPTIAHRSATGFEVAQPLFVTMGPSADLTLTPEYFFGPSAADVAEGKPSVRGPGGRLELRFAPAVDASGVVDLGWVHDQDREPSGAAGDRLEVTARHEQRLGAASRLRLDLGLESDPVWSRDFTTDVLLRQAFYRRSDVLASRAGDRLVLEADAAYYEPLTPPRTLSQGWDRQIPSATPGVLTPSAFGLFGSAIPVFHRWPALEATLLPASAGPVTVSGRAGLARFAPVTGDASAIALGPADPGARVDPVTKAPLLYATPREAATRLDARLELRAPVLVADVLSVEPYVRGAAAGYAFDGSRDPAAVAWAVGGAVVSTELSRAYGDTVHRIAPRVELRAGTGAVGPGGTALGVPAFDEWDRVAPVATWYSAVEGASGAPLASGAVRPVAAVTGLPLRPARSLSAAPEGRFGQLRLSVENRLTRAGADRLRLEVGQDLDVANGRAGESFFSAHATAGPVNADLSGRVLAFQGRLQPALEPRHDSLLDPFTELRAGVSVADHRGDAVRGGLLSVASGASGALMAGVDPLFDLRPAPVDAVAQATAGAQARIGGATLGYDALFAARTFDQPACSGTGTRTLRTGHLQQQAASFTWDSPCKCFLARVLVRLDDCGNSSFAASIDLSRLGDRVHFR